MNIPKILASMCPGAQWSLDGEAYSGLVWPEQKQAKPTEDELAAWVDPNAYKDKRAAAYPSIADQLDLLYHGGMDAWKAAITAVKEEFPK